MLKSIVCCLLIATAVILIPGCTNNNQQETTAATTELGKMLEKVPYSFLEKFDIFYGNMNKAKELNGVEDLDSFEAAREKIEQLPEEWQRQLAYDWAAASAAYPNWNRPDLAPLVGFDAYSFDRMVAINNFPPGVFGFAEGRLDEELIAAKLTEQGYTKTDYGDYSYYGIRDDFDIDLMSPLGQLLAALNRVAVFNDTLIVSPATEFVTDILDAMDRNIPSITDNDVCRALADSLGDPLAAAITTPERIIIDTTHVDDTAIFGLTIPESWGQLHEYEMAAFGYRADGDKRYFDIALYYADKNNAAADGKEIVGRMSSYNLNTWGGNPEKILFTERYLPGEPEVTKYGEGAVLKISCQLIPEGHSGATMLMGYMSIRDLLFLAVNPEEYIVK